VAVLTAPENYLRRLPLDGFGSTPKKSAARKERGTAMAYLPDFDEDVFISYTHDDDVIFEPEQWGWVTQLHQNLEKRVRNYLGSDVRLWRDCEIRNNEDFTKKIMNRLPRTAAFLSVLSPSFLTHEWCRRELESFAGHAQVQLGVLIDESSRIFKVEKMPVERDSLPQSMQGTKTYRFFYQPDPAQPKRTKELRPLLGPDYFRRYFEEMDELAYDIAELLKAMAKAVAAAEKHGEKPAEPDQPTVYLAETTQDLDEKRGQIQRELKSRGYTVLPDVDLPYRADAYKDKVREYLKQAVLSVHLIGAGEGFVPVGQTKSNVELQYDMAVERAGAGNLVRLIWLPRDVQGSEQSPLRDFIAGLYKDAGAQKGVDLLDFKIDKIEEFKTIIHDRLAEVRKQPNGASPAAAAAVAPAAASEPAKAAADEPLRVYIMTDAADRKSPSLAALREYLLSQGCEPMLPIQGEERSKALRVHTEYLRFCDACIVFYSQGSPEWYEAKLMDMRKYLRGRQPAVLAKAIYITAPSTEHKSDLKTLDAIVLREGETFSPAVFAPFVQKLHPAKSA
jgi:hypothetical protein